MASFGFIIKMKVKYKINTVNQLQILISLLHLSWNNKEQGSPGHETAPHSFVQLILSCWKWMFFLISWVQFFCKTPLIKFKSLHSIMSSLFDFKPTKITMIEYRSKNIKTGFCPTNYANNCICSFFCFISLFVKVKKPHNLYENSIFWLLLHPSTAWTFSQC